MFKVLTISLLATVLASSAVAQDRSGGGYEQRMGPSDGQRPDRVQMMVDQLGLSEEQSLEVQAIFDEADAQRRELRDADREDQCALRSIVEEQLAEVLTQDQFSQMEAMRNQNRSGYANSSYERYGYRQQGYGHRGKRGPGPGDCN